MPYIQQYTYITFEIYTCGELRSPVRVSWVLIKFINDRGRSAQTQFFLHIIGARCVPLPCRTLFHEELRPSNVVGYRGGTRKCVENGWKVVMDRVALSTSNPLNAIHTNYTRDGNNTFTVRRRKRQGPRRRQAARDAGDHHTKSFRVTLWTHPLVTYKAVRITTTTTRIRLLPANKKEKKTKQKKGFLVKRRCINFEFYSTEIYIVHIDER